MKMVKDSQAAGSGGLLEVRDNDRTGIIQANSRAGL